MKFLDQHALILCLCFAFASTGVKPLWADDVEDQQKKCDDALDEADKQLQQMMYRNQALATASQQAPNQQSQQQGQTPSTGSPIGDFLAKMAEGQQKQAELEQQRLQQIGQVQDQELQQLMENKDKVHEYRQQEYKQRQEAISLEFARKRSDRDLDRQCEDQARQQAIARQGNSNASIQTGTNAVSSMSQLSGTSKRMAAMESVDLNDCKMQKLADKKLNLDEYNAKLRNINLAAQANQSDIAYTESKASLITMQGDAKIDNINQAAQIQRDALAQANQMNMMALGMAMATSNANANSAIQSAGTANSASTVLQNFTQIQQICKNAVNQAFDVPADIYPIFTTVNMACRPDATNSRYCVRSTGVQSQDQQNLNRAQ